MKAGGPESAYEGCGIFVKQGNQNRLDRNRENNEENFIDGSERWST